MVELLEFNAPSLSRLSGGKEYVSCRDAFYDSLSRLSGGKDTFHRLWRDGASLSRLSGGKGD